MENKFYYLYYFYRCTFVVIGSEYAVKVTYCINCKLQVVGSEVNLVEEGEQDEFAEGRYQFGSKTNTGS